MAKAYFARKSAEVSAFIAEMENKEAVSPPVNKTLGKITAIKSSLVKLRDTFDAYLPAQPLTQSPWIKRIPKIPALPYAHIVIILQFVSAVGNVKTLGDDSTFFVTMLAFAWESFTNPTHSAVFMAGRPMRYSEGMAISTFTAGIHLLNDHAVFDKDPEFTGHRAIVTGLLNLTITVRFVPGFELMTTCLVEMIERIRCRQAARAVSAEMVPLIEELDDEDSKDSKDRAPTPDPNEYSRIIWGFILENMEEMREKDTEEKALDDEEDAENKEVDPEQPNFIDMLSAAEITEDSKGATRDVISLFNIFPDLSAAVDELNEPLGKLRLSLF